VKNTDSEHKGRQLFSKRNNCSYTKIVRKLSEEEIRVLMFEPKSTVCMGSADSDKTMTFKEHSIDL
jgi:hypothetical protein